MTPSLQADWTPALVPAAAVCARVITAVAVGTLPLGSALPIRVRVAVAVALAAAAWPQAAAAVRPGPSAFAVVGEVVVGLGLGLVVAATCAAAAWAGGIIGSVAGLAWADDFTPDGDAQSAGLARLAWWLGLAGFLAAGGHLAVVAGLIDSFQALPVGVGPAAITDRVVAAAGSAVHLALSLAGPALAAVTAFHVAAAICLRTIRLVPGAGMLQAAAAAVAIALVVAGLPTWIDGFGTAARSRVEQDLAGAVSVIP